MQAGAHPVDEVLPVPRLAALGLRHVLVMYAGAVAVPLIVGRALELSPEQVAILISADLFACGIATLNQSVGLPFVGIRLPVMMGVTFASVGQMLAMAGNADVGLLGIYGAVIVAGIFGLLVAPFVSRLLPLFPPVVTGTIILVIGISLMRVGVNWAGGGMPTFDVVASLTMCLVMIVVMIESTGMFLALGEMTDRKIDEESLSKGLRADGLGTLIGGIFNTFPYTSFSQNVGLVGVTVVRSRWVTAVGGVFLLALGLMPKMSAVVEGVPVVGLGGAGLVVFGMVAATGARILGAVDFRENRHNLFIVALTVGFGMIPLRSDPPHLAVEIRQMRHPQYRLLLEGGEIAATVSQLLGADRRRDIGHVPADPGTVHGGADIAQRALQQVAQHEHGVTMDAVGCQHVLA